MTETQRDQESTQDQDQESTVAEQDTRQERESQGSFDAEYVKTLRDENAKTRKRLRELEEKEEAEKKARMSEIERVKAEKEEAAKSAQSAQTALQTERLTYAAERLATKLGGMPERAEGIARLADLTSVDFDDNGKPDAKQVQAAISKALEEYPELKASQRLNNEGFTPADDLENGEKNPFERGEHWNLTKQGELFQKSPELAKRLQKAAKN